MRREVGEVIRSVVRFDDSGETGRQRGSRGRSGFVDEVFRLDVIQVRKAGGPFNGFVEQVAIGGGVNLNDEGRKEDMHTEATHPNKSASTLALMGTQAVEGVAKVRDVKTVAKQNFLAVKRYNRRTLAGDRGEGVVPHPNATS
jgi:hypothetical protein